MVSAKDKRVRKTKQDHFSPAREKSDPHALGPTQGTRPQVVTPKGTPRYWILLHTRGRVLRLPRPRRDVPQ